MEGVDGEGGDFSNESGVAVHKCEFEPHAKPVITDWNDPVATQSPRLLRSMSRSPRRAY